MKKSIIAGAIVALLSTSAFAAEDFKIQGATDDLPAGCTFLNLQDGAMEWDESTNSWYTSSDAQIRVKTRDILGLSVATDKALYDAIGAVDDVVEVDYSASTAQGENTRKNVSIATDENLLVITTDAGGNVLNIGVDHGVLASDSFVAEDNTSYWMINTATCTQ